MENKKILIAGGLGFIGSHAAIFFSDLGYQISIIDNLSRPYPNIKENMTHYNLTYFKDNYPFITIYHEDLRNFKNIQDIFNKTKPDIIIYAAGQTSAIDSIVNPKNDFENNVIALYNTLELTRISNFPINFIYLSTNKVYGDNINQLPLVEDKMRYLVKNKDFTGISEKYSIDQSKHTPYGISKLTGDLYVQEYGKTYNINTAILRLSCIYGARQFGFEEQGWISHIIINSILKKPIRIFGNGKQVRDILYITDLLKLIKCIVESMNNSPHIKNFVLNVGGSLDNSISILELLNILEGLQKTNLNTIILPERPADQKVYITDIKKVNILFNWKPLIDPKEGIKKVYDWTKKKISLFK